jgi:hypothetical protein
VEGYVKSLTYDDIWLEISYTLGCHSLYNVNPRNQVKSKEYYYKILLEYSYDYLDTLLIIKHLLILGPITLQASHFCKVELGSI